MNKKKSIFDFAKSQNVTCLKEQETKAVKGGDWWKMVKKAFAYEWEKANRPEPTLREQMNNGSNGAVR